MRISPPELQVFDKQRYFSDLAYRQDEDEQRYSEWRERLKLLLLFAPQQLNT